MRTLRTLFTWTALALLSASWAGCEPRTTGTLAILWQFNGNADTDEQRPCGGAGADRIIVEFTGPDNFMVVADCNAVSADAPYIWLGRVADLSVTAFGFMAKDVPGGDYQVSAYFLDKQDNILDLPAAVDQSVTVENGAFNQLFLDFPLTTGAIAARWRLADGDYDCEELDASSIALTAYDSGGAEVASATLDCGETSWSVPGLPAGDYSVEGVLLDSTGAALTSAVTNAGLTVTAANPTSTRLEFGLGLFGLTNNVRFSLALDDPATACSDATGLANPGLQTRLLLATSGGTPVVGAATFANPAGQDDCGGLGAGLTLDGTTLGACPDVEQIICDLPVGDYLLTANALDASDMVCFTAQFPISVGLDMAAPEIFVLESSDATLCWE